MEVLIVVLNKKVSPAERNAHLQQKKPRNTNHERNKEYSPPKYSDNEVSVVLSFSASANAFAPSVPILLSADTREWRDPYTNSAK
jgi:hypothetical protein